MLEQQFFLRLLAEARDFAFDARGNVSAWPKKDNWCLYNRDENGFTVISGKCGH